jgi:hypothetical protein
MSPGFSPKGEKIFFGRNFPHFQSKEAFGYAGLARRTQHIFMEETDPLLTSPFQGEGPCCTVALTTN